MAVAGLEDLLSGCGKALKTRLLDEASSGTPKVGPGQARLRAQTSGPQDLGCVKQMLLSSSHVMWGATEDTWVGTDSPQPQGKNLSDAGRAVTVKKSKPHV